MSDLERRNYVLRCHDFFLSFLFFFLAKRVTLTTLLSSLFFLLFLFSIKHVTSNNWKKKRYSQFRCIKATETCSRSAKNWRNMRKYEFRCEQELTSTQPSIFGIYIKHIVYVCVCYFMKFMQTGRPDIQRAHASSTLLQILPRHDTPSRLGNKVCILIHIRIHTFIAVWEKRREPRCKYRVSAYVLRFSSCCTVV